MQARQDYQAARCRQPHIEQGERHRMVAGVRKKILGICEALGLQPIGIEQLLNGIPHRSIVIDNAYGLRLCGHGISTGIEIQLPVRTYDTYGPKPIAPWGSFPQKVIHNSAWIVPFFRVDLP